MTCIHPASDVSKVVLVEGIAYIKDREYAANQWIEIRSATLTSRQKKLMRHCLGKRNIYKSIRIFYSIKNVNKKQ